MLVTICLSSCLVVVGDVFLLSLSLFRSSCFSCFSFVVFFVFSTSPGDVAVISLSTSLVFYLALPFAVLSSLFLYWRVLS